MCYCHNEQWFHWTKSALSTNCKQIKLQTEPNHSSFMSHSGLTALNCHVLEAVWLRLTVKVEINWFLCSVSANFLRSTWTVEYKVKLKRFTIKIIFVTYAILRFKFIQLIYLLTFLHFKPHKGMPPVKAVTLLWANDVTCWTPMPYSQQHFVCIELYAIILSDVPAVRLIRSLQGGVLCSSFHL